MLFAAARESATGTNRTSRNVRSMVANGGKQTWGEPSISVAIEPIRDIGPPCIFLPATDLCITTVIALDLLIAS